MLSNFKSLICCVVALHLKVFLCSHYFVGCGGNQLLLTFTVYPNQSNSIARHEEVKQPQYQNIHKGRVNNSPRLQ